MDEPRITTPGSIGHYRVTTRVRVLASALAALACLVCYGLLRLSRSAGHAVGDPVVWAVIVCGLLPALWFALVAWTSRLQLNATALTLRHPFGVRELRLAELRGVRSRYTRAGRRLPDFEPRHGKTLSLYLPYTTDHRYELWLASLPDLDARDRADAAAALLADPRLGANPAERAQRLAWWARIARWDAGVAVSLAVWTLAYPHPYAWSITALVVAPWLALLLVWRSGGALRISLDRNDARPQVASVLLAAPLLIVMRTAMDLDLLAWGRACGLGVLAGLPLLLAIFVQQGSHARRRSAMVLYALFCWAYGVGVVAAGNVLLDHEPSRVFSAQVEGMRATHGRHSSYKLRLRGALPAGHDDWYAVASRRYDATRRGDTVCVYRHAGALGMPWVAVASCPD